MFLVSFNLVSFTGASFGPSVTAVGITTPKGERSPKGPPVELSIPWQRLTENPTVFALLSWHTAMSDFVGRDAEIAELSRWANSNHPLSIKFLTGDGGVGKSRLAAQFADTLRGEGWAAGFLNLRKPMQFPLKKKGTLLVIDYPEQHLSSVGEMLRDLAEMEQSERLGRLKVLFLSRQPIERWEQIIADNNAMTLLDTVPVVLKGMYERPAYDVFCTAQENAADVLETTPLPTSERDLLDWLNQAEENQRALFIVAAAVQSAIHAEENVFGYTGPEVIDSLSEREIIRLHQSAKEQGIKDINAFARVLAIAVLAGELSSERVAEFANTKQLQLGLPKGTGLSDMLSNAMLLSDGMVRPPQPDIPAAAFTVKVLSKKPQTAPELIWSCLYGNIEAGLERITRIAYDTEILLGIHQNRISKYFAAALENRPERCKLLDEHFSKILPMTSLSASIVVWKTLLSIADDDGERSRLLNNLSIALAQFGDRVGALEAIREAVDIRRRLAKANPAAFEPDLAMSLNNLSLRLSDVGDREGALETIRDAADIYRRLAKANPAAFEPNLAGSLGNLSRCLNDVGDREGALEAIREAVDIYRRLAKANPAAFEPDLAGSLNNLAKHLSDVGDRVGVLKAIREAVDVYRRLAKANPAAFEPNLAGSLNNLANGLGNVGDRVGALKAIREAVDIRRRLAKANPAAFEPELARSLGVLGLMLRESRNTSKAIDAFREGIELIRPFAKNYSQSSHAELLKTLEKDLKETE